MESEVPYDGCVGDPQTRSTECLKGSIRAWHWPPGLDVGAIRRAIQFTEESLNDRDFIDLYFEQANVFSAIVGMYGTKALDSVSNYEKHRHSFEAADAVPTTCGDGVHPCPCAPADCLESKASKRPWSIQSHYNHPGWYIVWRYLVDATRTIKPGSVCGGLAS